MISLLLVIVVLLMLASVAVEVKLRKHYSAETENNQKRILSWWAILVVCAPVFYIGDWLLVGFVLVLVYWASSEFSRLCDSDFSIGNGIVILLFSVAYLSLIQVLSAYTWVFLPIPLLSAVISFVCVVRSRRYQTIVILLCVSALATLLSIEHQSQVLNMDSGLVLLMLFFLTASNDIAQYVSGKLFGKHALVPSVSPEKTVEGAVGGMVVTSLLMVYFLSQHINFSWVAALVAGGMMSLAGILGDIHISFYKRLAGVKDTGNLIPGHGGLLDRVDSLLLTAPVFGICLEMLL